MAISLKPTTVGWYPPKGFIGFCLNKINQFK